MASGLSHTITDLVGTARRAHGFAPAIRYSHKARAGDPDVWVASIDRLQNTGFTSQTPLEEGLRETLAWLQEERRIGE